MDVLNVFRHTKQVETPKTHVDGKPCVDHDGKPILVKDLVVDPAEVLESFQKDWRTGPVNIAYIFKHTSELYLVFVIIFSTSVKWKRSITFRAPNPNIPEAATARSPSRNNPRDHAHSGPRSCKAARFDFEVLQGGRIVIRLSGQILPHL